MLKTPWEVQPEPDRLYGPLSLYSSSLLLFSCPGLPRAGLGVPFGHSSLKFRSALRLVRHNHEIMSSNHGDK